MTAVGAVTAVTCSHGPGHRGRVGHHVGQPGLPQAGAERLVGVIRKPGAVAQLDRQRAAGRASRQRRQVFEQHPGTAPTARTGKASPSLPATSRGRARPGTGERPPRRPRRRAWCGPESRRAASPPSSRGKSDWTSKGGVSPAGGGRSWGSRPWRIRSEDLAACASAHRCTVGGGSSRGSHSRRVDLDHVEDAGEEAQAGLRAHGLGVKVTAWMRARWPTRLQRPTRMSDDLLVHPRRGWTRKTRMGWETFLKLRSPRFSSTNSRADPLGRRRPDDDLAGLGRASEAGGEVGGRSGRGEGPALAAGACRSWWRRPAPRRC